MFNSLRRKPKPPPPVAYVQIHEAATIARFALSELGSLAMHHETGVLTTLQAREERINEARGLGCVSEQVERSLDIELQTFLGAMQDLATRSGQQIVDLVGMPAPSPAEYSGVGAGEASSFQVPETATVATDTDSERLETAGHADHRMLNGQEPYDAV